MGGNARSNGEFAGWVILSPEAVPEVWASRAVPMMLVPLAPSEAAHLFSNSPVQRDVAPADLPLIRLLARGHSATESARALGISPRTVNRHVARLRDEFDASSLQELATELARRGF